VVVAALLVVGCYHHAPTVKPEAVNYVKKGYQPRTGIVKDEKGDLVADSYSIMVRWRNSFSQILYVYVVSDVRQAELHTAEPLVPKPNALEMELNIEKKMLQIILYCSNTCRTD
jgi:hypothetical protein